MYSSRVVQCVLQLMAIFLYPIHVASFQLNHVWITLALGWTMVYPNVERPAISKPSSAEVFLPPDVWWRTCWLLTLLNGIYGTHSKLWASLMLSNGPPNKSNRMSRENERECSVLHFDSVCVCVPAKTYTRLTPHTLWETHRHTPSVERGWLTGSQRGG